MNIYLVVTILILIIICIWYFEFFNETVYVLSKVDNKHYIIRTGLNKSPEYLQQSADTLATINIRVERLIKHLVNKYSNDTKKWYYLKKLQENYKPYILSEAAIDTRYTTFTIDKSDMHVCLRTRDSHQNLYDINTLMYVVLHELAHLCNYDEDSNPIHGHGFEFLKIFDLLVREAISIDVYTYINYRNKPQEYCGIVINSQIIKT